MIRNKLAPKHQKLIRQCYPPGAKGLDKRPNASELSYLLYYVSTRRVKLTKVAIYLEKTTRTDVSRERFSNIQVTLEIFDALIHRCHEDLNLFAPYVVSILLAVLQKADISLAQSAGKVFATFSQYHNGDLFAGDSDYVKAFHSLVLQFVGLASRHNTTGAVDLQWVQVSMEAAKSASASAALATRVGQKEITTILPPVLDTLSLAQDFNGSSLLSLQQQWNQSNDENNGDDRIGSILNKRKSVVVIPPTPPSIVLDDSEEKEEIEREEEDEDEDEQNEDSSSKSTQHLPHISSLSNMTFKTKKLLEHVSNSTSVIANNAASVASSTAANVATTASRVSFSSHHIIPETPDDDSNAHQENEILITSLQALVHLFDSTALIQVRHAALSVVGYIIDHDSPATWSSVLIQLVTTWTPVQLRFVVLSALVEKFVGLKLDNFPLQKKIAHLIKSLLTSSVSMVGLSVMDILRSLLHHQQRFIIIDTKPDNDLQFKNMTVITRTTIAALASHNYYSDQVSDMIGELLARSVHGGAVVSGSLSTNITTDSDEQSRPPTNTASRPEPLFNPKISQSLVINDLLNIRDILDVVAANKDSSTVRVPLSVWQGTESLLSHENLNIIGEFTSVFIKYLQSDLISIDKSRLTSKNDIEKLSLKKFIHIVFNAIREPSCSSATIVAAYHILISFLNRFGIHSVIGILPQLWSLEDVAIESEHRSNGTYSVSRGVELSSFVLAILFAIGTELSLDKFTSTIEDSISFRKKNQIWYNSIKVPLTTSIQEVSNCPEVEASAETTSRTVPVDRKILMDQFHVEQWGLSDELRVKLFQNATEHANEDLSEYATTGLHKARSLKQLKRSPLSVHSFGSGNHNNILSMNTTRAARNGSLNASIESRRDFSPRVNDLRRAVSGALLNGNSVSSLRQAAFANDGPSNSTTSSLSVHSVSNYNENVSKESEDFRERVDLDSFLNDLNISYNPERGRLTT